MSRATLITGLLLVAFGLGVFLTKAVVYDVPVTPSDVRGLWQVALRVTVRGEKRRGSVTVQLPASDDGQRIFDEATSGGGLDHTIRTTDGSRIGVWTGRFSGVHEIRHRFRVQTFGRKVALPDRSGEKPPDDLMRAYGRGSPVYPITAPQVLVALDELALPTPADVVGRVRTIFAFVRHEIATARSAGEDAVLVLDQREGSREGKELLLVTLLRAAGIPARNVRGLVLVEDAPPMERVWSQGWIDGTWVPMSTVDGFFAVRPDRYVVLGIGDAPLVDATDVRAMAYRYQSLREHLRPSEVAAAMTPDNEVLARLSLYRLPLAAQSALRLLLVLPVGALATALYRNVIGLPTFGTFMPILIAFSLRGFDLSTGLGLIVFVLAFGVLSRLTLDRLRLLLVPRLSLLLCLVVLTVTGLAVVGQGRGIDDLFAGVLFPLVILTMLIERFSIAIAEEGWREASLRALSSVVVVIVVYPVFTSVHVEHVMFSFPELVVSIMGLLVWIGGYMGYRLTDAIRFRTMLAPTDPEART